MDDASDAGEAVGCMPAYGVSPETLADGPQCSQSGEWCFLCAFQPSEDLDTCPYTSITDLVSHMAAQKRELPNIINAVHSAYNSTIRDTISHQHPDTGEVIEKPVWTKSSIQRHLLFSNQGACSGLHDQLIRHILHSIIVRHNATMVDERGECVESKRKAFCDTLKALQSWEKHIGMRGEGGHDRKRPRKG